MLGVVETLEVEVDLIGDRGDRLERLPVAEPRSLDGRVDTSARSERTKAPCANGSPPLTVSPATSVDIRKIHVRNCDTLVIKDVIALLCSPS